MLGAREHLVAVVVVVVVLLAAHEVRGTRTPEASKGRGLKENIAMPFSSRGRGRTVAEAPFRAQHGAGVANFSFADDTLVFVHIPKTGGTAFEAELVTLPVLRSRFHGLDSPLLPPTDEVFLPCSCAGGRDPREGAWKPSSSSSSSSSSPSSSSSSSLAASLPSSSLPAALKPAPMSPGSCKCPRPVPPGSSSLPRGIANQWLVARLTFGWECGVHPDYWRLRSCLDLAHQVSERAASGPAFGVGRPRPARRVFFVTVLRDPVARFVSETKHLLAHSDPRARWPEDGPARFALPSDYVCDSGARTRILPSFDVLFPNAVAAPAAATTTTTSSSTGERDGAGGGGGQTVTRTAAGGGVFYPPVSHPTPSQLAAALTTLLTGPDHAGLNRQTKMIAGPLSCAPPGESAEARDQRLLAAAQRALRETLDGFGLLEEPLLSRRLFHRLLDLDGFLPLSERTRQEGDRGASLRRLELEARFLEEDGADGPLLSEDLQRLIRERNALDVQLYDFAKQLLHERARELGITAGT